VKPDAVAGLKVRNLGNGEGHTVAGDADVDARADQVKARVGGGARPDEREQKDKEN
jgi:hypothetical protein